MQLAAKRRQCLNRQIVIRVLVSTFVSLRVMWLDCAALKRHKTVTNVSEAANERLIKPELQILPKLGKQSRNS